MFQDDSSILFWFGTWSLWNITSFFFLLYLKELFLPICVFVSLVLVVSCSMACCLRVLKWKVSLEHALSHTLLGLRIGTRHPNFRFGLWRESFILQVMQQKNKRPSCQSLVSSCIYWVLFCMLSTLRSGHLKLAPGMVRMVHSRRIAIFVIRKSLWGFEFSYMSGPAVEKRVALFLLVLHAVEFLTTSLSPRLWQAVQSSLSASSATWTSCQRRCWPKTLC